VTLTTVFSVEVSLELSESLLLVSPFLAEPGWTFFGEVLGVVTFLVVLGLPLGLAFGLAAVLDFEGVFLTGDFLASETSFASASMT
jgi:hypothetical protein